MELRQLTLQVIDDFAIATIGLTGHETTLLVELQTLRTQFLHLLLLPRVELVALVLQLLDGVILLLAEEG